MNIVSKKAFTMIELVFAIVIIGILSAVAIPKFAANRADAEIAKAKSTIAAVRVAIATERQKRALRGKFKKIYSLNAIARAQTIFDYFDNNLTETILEYPLISCSHTDEQSCWKETTQGTESVPGVYRFTMPVSGHVDFTLLNNQFSCDLSDTNCLLLSQ